MSSSTWAQNLRNISTSHRLQLQLASNRLRRIITLPTVRIIQLVPPLLLLWSFTNFNFNFNFHKRLWASYLLPVHQFLRRLLPDRLLLARSRPPPTPTYDTYKSASEEDTYWKKALSGQKILQLSDAHFAQARKQHVPDHDVYTPPLVMYYTPALLPEHFDADARRKEKKLTRLKKGYRISAKNYWKWHWMVFPGQDHPSMKEANRLRYLHTPSELRVIDHIARKLPDDKFIYDPKRVWSPRYQKMWLDWFNSPERERTRTQGSSF